jgi:hypothetical protein
MLGIQYSLVLIWDSAQAACGRQRCIQLQPIQRSETRVAGVVSNGAPTLVDLLLEPQLPWESAGTLPVKVYRILCILFSSYCNACVSSLNDTQITA